MPFCCFRPKIREPRQPPPTLAVIDGPAVIARGDGDLVKPHNNNPISGPPLPSRNIETPSTQPNTYQKEAHPLPISPVASPPTSPTKIPVTLRSKPKPPPIDISGRQLSTEILSTPVPIGGRTTPSVISDQEFKRSLSRADSEDYLQPASDSLPSTNQPTTNTETRRLKASLSDDKKADIMRDYHSMAVTPDLTVKVPRRTTNSSSSADSSHDYTNVIEYPSPPTSSRSPRWVADRQPLAQSNSGNSKSSSESEGFKSPRRPKPMPRSHNGTLDRRDNTRKHSLTTSEPDDTTFPYENVGEPAILTSDSSSNVGSKPTTPRPQPRARVAVPDSNSGRSTPRTAGQHSPTSNNNQVVPPLLLQQQFSKDGYVTDVECDYLNPDPSPNSTLRRMPTPPSGRKGSLPSNGLVNLNAPIPRGKQDTGLAASNPKKGYLPMDHSPRTKAVSKSGALDGMLSVSGVDLNFRVPVGNVNDVHVPGYITILSPIPKAKTPSGPYYNISEQSDYLNPDISTHEDMSDNTQTESPYYG